MSKHYVSNRAPLHPGAFVPLPLGFVRPLGWLREQCSLQANGFTGHIEEFWPDLGPDNMWLGGKTEGWERGPYYLDGLVPLAHILDDDRLKAKAQRWIDSILSMQDETGWLGPIQAPDRRPYDQWPVAIVMKVLTQHYEATGDARVLDVMTGFCRYLRDTLDAHPLFEWGQYRWADLILSIYWLYNRTGEAWLLDVAAKAAAQGYDWRTHFEQFPYKEKTRLEDCTLATHVVNSAMGLKSCGVHWQQTGDEQDRMGVYRAMEMLDTYHGQATGVFAGDEHYAGRSPIQGTELCAVVEYMFSLEELLAICGEPEHGDRLERIAYNALPATFTPDMWAHQYDQQTNQVLCTIAPRVWTNNFDDSNIYGLEPNYGCCTSNLHQGWPKFVKSLWMATPDDGLAAVAYGPCQVTAKVGEGAQVTVTEETDYPFDPIIRFTIQAERPVTFPLLLRIPEWAGANATIARNEGEPQRVEAGTFHRIIAEWQSGDVVTLKLPMSVRLERRYRNAVTLHYGPLVFALKMGESFEVLKGTPPLADFAVHPTTPWNYGLVLGNGTPDTLFTVQKQQDVNGPPFSPDAAPLILTARARRIPQWKMERNSAAPVPDSPAPTDAPTETITLIPYGCTNLRITEFPEVTPEWQSVPT